MQYLQNNPVDLVFLDIQMPGMTGLQLVSSLPQKPLFIFVTAYEQYAIQGFELDVVDYLLKPVRRERFATACERALEIFKVNSKPASVVEERTYLFIQADYMMVRVNFEDLLWVEGHKDYMKFHFKTTQKPLVARTSMKALEDLLPERLFIRIHKSHLVAKSAITAIQKNAVFLNGTELPVGEMYREQLLAFMGGVRG